MQILSHDYNGALYYLPRADVCPSLLKRWIDIDVESMYPIDCFDCIYNCRAFYTN